MGKRDNFETLKGKTSSTSPDAREDEHKKTSRIPWRALSKIFIFRIPTWIILIVLLGAGSFTLYNNITHDEPVNLRPIVYGARELRITFLVCDQVLKENNLEILSSEKRLESQFMDIEKVDKVRVRINRASDKDCEVVDQTP